MCLFNLIGGQGGPSRMKAVALFPPFVLDKSGLEATAVLGGFPSLTPAGRPGVELH